MALGAKPRVRLPMGLLSEPLPAFSAGEPNVARKLSFIDRRAPFVLLYQVLTRLGYEVADFPVCECDRYLSWTAKSVPDEAWDDKAIVLEVGWIPRWSYQVSPTGSNAQGHYAREYEFTPLSEDAAGLVRRQLSRLREIYRQSVDWRKVESLQRRLGEPFLLFAFQLANDHNLRFSDTAFSKYYAPAPDRNLELAQACIDAVEAEASPLPLVYKQHPFDPTPAFAASLSVRGTVLDNEDDVSTHELFATGLCRGVVSINSNSIHDAAVWDVPSLCLGSLVWNPRTARPPFPRSLADLRGLSERRPSETPETLSYLYHLIRHQWTLGDFQNGVMVERLLDCRGRCAPLDERRSRGLVG